MQKIDFKKKYKNLYSAKENVFSTVKVPKLSYINIEGLGHPKEKEFQQAVEALYNVVYTIKMMPRSGEKPKGYFEYVVPPLECLYWLVPNSKKFGWKQMIMQPKFVDKKLVERAKKIVASKKQLPALPKINFENFGDGKSVQTLHIGPYDKIGVTCKKIEEYLKTNNLKENGKWHEIYLSDPRKTVAEKLKTIVRIPIK
jgi:hypothetical protein